MKRILVIAPALFLFLSHAYAVQSPRPGALDNRVTSVSYQKNNVVKVNATYGISTMIIFDDDEKFETISLGDTDSWQVAPSQKGNVLFVKPVAKNVATNMNIVTNKRIYFLELLDFASGAGKQTFGIRFIYPDKQEDALYLKEAQARVAMPNLANVDKTKINWQYSFTGDMTLKPVAMFDDGKKTFFKFADKVPAIFAVKPGYRETLRNFRKEGDYLVVDGVAAQYTLRDGNQWICLFNLGLPDLPSTQRGIFSSNRNPSRAAGG